MRLPSHAKRSRAGSARCWRLLALWSRPFTWYLANIGVGIFELSPDNLPGIGNIDEFLFSLLLIYCLQKLGVNLLPILRPRASGPRDIIPR